MLGRTGIKLTAESLMNITRPIYKSIDVKIFKIFDF